MKQLSSNIIRIIMGSIVAIMTVTVSSASAQTAADALRFSQREISVGARMTGMSTRGFAGIGDYGAMHSNPAGIGYVRDSQFNISIRGSDIANDLHTDGLRLDNNRSTVDRSGLGSISVLYDVPVTQGSLVGGLGVSRVRDFTRVLNFSGVNANSTISTSFLPFDNEYSIDEEGNLLELNDLPFAAFNAGVFEYYQDLYLQGEYPFYEAVVPGSAIEQLGDVTEGGSLYEATAAVAWEATKDMMVGVSANLILGHYSFDYRFTERDIFNENTGEHYDVLLDDGGLLQGFDELIYEQRLRSDMAGFNFRAGVSTKLGSAFRLGATFESPTWSYIEESYGEQFATRFDVGGELSYGERSDDVGNGYFEYSLRSPWRLGAGLQFHSGSLKLTAEGELVDWGKLKLSSDDGGDIFREANREIANTYEMAINVALGAEWEFGRFNIRGGVAARPAPYESNVLESAVSDTPEPGALTAASFGFGFRFTDRVRMDLGVQRVVTKDYWHAYPTDAGGPRQDAQVQIDESLTRDIAVLELTWKF